MRSDAVNERRRPFYCGTQLLDWQDRNCQRCAKYDAGKSPASACEIVVALAEAQRGDGSVSAHLARRMGYVDELTLASTWDCPEREFPAKGATA